MCLKAGLRGNKWKANTLERANISEVNMNRFTAIGVFALSLAALVPATGRSQQPAWKPQKNIEIITGVSAGGALDRTARLIQAIIKDNRLVAPAVTVINRPGGGGALGWNYLNQHAGDGHYVAVGNNTLLTNHIQGKVAVNFTDLTPVALLFNEYIAFAARSDSPLRTGRDLIDRLKADPGGLSFAFATARGNAQHITIAMVARATGSDIKKLKTVVFNSGGEAVTAVLGGHVDIVVATASSVVPHMASGKLRAIAVASGERLWDAFAQVPTWKEQQVNVVMPSWRGVFGARGMPREQTEFWESVIAGLVKTEKWQNELERNLWQNVYTGSVETRKHLEAEYVGLKGILTELGVVQ